MIRDTRIRWMKAASKLFGASQPPAPIPRESLPDLKDESAFVLRDQLLNADEQEFFHVLQDALWDLAIVCPKTRATDVLSIVDGAKQMNEAVRIDRKSIDFLVCDRSNFEPLLAVQIDWWCEETQSYEPRDRVLQRSLVAAKLAVVHLRSNQIPDAKTLRERLSHHLENRRRLVRNLPR